MKKYPRNEDFAKAQASDSKSNNELKKLADSLNETDNPILVLVRLKK